MPPQLSLPIRVLVRGASTISVISPMGGDRTDFALPRVIEQRLLADGRPVELRASAVPGERTKDFVRGWEREVIGFSPDALVLCYGHLETIHSFLPWRLERHANSFRARPGRWRETYRNRLLRPAWLLLAQLQAKADAVVEPTLRRSRPRRVAADLERLLERLRYTQNPLVLLLEIQPPAKRYRSWFPGMAARVAVMNDALSAMVRRLDDPNVRWVTTTDVIAAQAGGDIDLATPDGFHYSADLHRAIGTKLARIIAEWADGQPHLKRGTEGSEPDA